MVYGWKGARESSRGMGGGGTSFTFCWEGRERNRQEGRRWAGDGVSQRCGAFVHPAEPPDQECSRLLLHTYLVCFTRRLRIAGIVLLALILIGAASAGVMASLAERQRREAEKQRVIAEEATRNAQNSAEEKEAQAKAAELARERACFAFLEADRDRHRAQIANNVSTAALIQSALNKYLGDPSMAASEVWQTLSSSCRLRESHGRSPEGEAFRRRLCFSWVERGSSGLGVGIVRLLLEGPFSHAA